MTSEIFLNGEFGPPAVRGLRPMRLLATRVCGTPGGFSAMPGPNPIDPVRQGHITAEESRCIADSMPSAENLFGDLVAKSDTEI